MNGAGRGCAGTIDKEASFWSGPGWRLGWVEVRVRRKWGRCVSLGAGGAAEGTGAKFWQVSNDLPDPKKRSSGRFRQ